MDELIYHAEVGGNLSLPASYLQGSAEMSRDTWVGELLDSWTQKDPQKALLVFEATRCLGGSDEGAIRLSELFRKGWVSSALIGWLAYGKWINPITLPAFRTLLESIIPDDNPQTIEGGLSLLMTWLIDHPESSGDLANQALALLTKSASITSRGMFAYYWEQVAVRYSAKFPSEIAKAVLKTFAILPPAFHLDEQKKVLEETLRQAPTEVWPLIGDALLTESIWYGLFDEFSFDAIVNITDLISWAKTHEPDGIYVLAHIARVGGSLLFSLARQLLILYGSDKKISGRLAAKVFIGTWSGSEVTWLQGKLSMIKKWLDDDEPNVRDWARMIIQQLELDIKRAKQREDEEDLFY